MLRRGLFTFAKPALAARLRSASSSMRMRRARSRSRLRASFSLSATVFLSNLSTVNVDCAVAMVISKLVLALCCLLHLIFHAAQLHCISHSHSDDGHNDGQCCRVITLVT